MELFRVFIKNRYYSPDYIDKQTEQSIKTQKNIEVFLIIKFSESLVDTVNISSVIPLEWEQDDYFAY